MLTSVSVSHWCYVYFKLFSQQFSRETLDTISKRIFGMKNHLTFRGRGWGVVAFS